VLSSLVLVWYEMKVVLACSPGGHFTEMARLSECFAGHEIVWIVPHSPRSDVPRAYRPANIGTSPVKAVRESIRMWKWLFQEKPDVVVSTGAEIAIPVAFWCWLARRPFVYIESVCRVRSLSATGLLVRPFSTVFLVQWPELAGDSRRGPEYWGSVL